MADQEGTPSTRGEIREVTFRIHRSGDATQGPSIDHFQVPAPRGMTVLEGLHHIKEHQDGTLAYRYSCRMGVCGSCGMFINGLPRLACNLQIEHLHSDVVEVKPLPNFDTIRDLVPNLGHLFEKHRAIRPYILRNDLAEMEKPTGEFIQTPEELLRYLQFSYCIKCGLCISACPTAATDDTYIGPQALTQAHRYNTDSRDEGFGARLGEVDIPEGPWRCHFAGACSEACPKGVDPALGIQLLKQDIILRKLRLRRARPGASVAPKVTEPAPRPGIPKAPPPTVQKS